MSATPGIIIKGPTFSRIGINPSTNLTILALFTFAMHCLPSTGVLFKRRIIFAYGLRLARLITTGRWSKCA